MGAEIKIKEKTNPKESMENNKTTSPTVPSEKKWHFSGRSEMFPPDGGMAVKIAGKQIAVFNFSSRKEWYACDNLCPHKKYQVLARGILGEQGGEPKVACPMHKKNFFLKTGANPKDLSCRVETYKIKVEGGQVFVKA